MQRRFLFALFCVALIASASQAQTINAAGPSLSSTTSKSANGFTLVAVDESMIKQFNKAWKQSGQGMHRVEAGILILRNADGSYKAVSVGCTNEAYKLTFPLPPTTVAIVHTHPNDRNPRPTAGDIEVAERFNVPVFTITSRGMFMHDPAANQITKVHDGTDWLELSKWSVKFDTTRKQEIAKR